MHYIIFIYLFANKIKYKNNVVKGGTDRERWEGRKGCAKKEKRYGKEEVT